LYILYQGGLEQILLAIAVIQLTLYLERMYGRSIALPYLLRQMFLALGVAFLLQVLLAYTHSSTQMPRWTMIYGAFLALVAFPMLRLAVSATLGKAVPLRRLLFLGASRAAAEIGLCLKGQPELGLEVIGYLGSKGETGLPCLGEMRDFGEIVEKYAPHRILIGRYSRGLRQLLELQRAGTRMDKLASLYEAVAGRISLLELPPERLNFSSDLDPRPVYVIARDIYSVLNGVLLLVPAAVALAVAAVVIKRSSRGPAFERERRVGMNGALSCCTGSGTPLP
jgi:FlaA1/EpsC-like NDP-sugar epimerase